MRLQRSTAISLPDGNPRVQTNDKGESCAVSLNINDTKATWMGFLPHNWPAKSTLATMYLYVTAGWRSDRAIKVRRNATDLGLLTETTFVLLLLADAFTICDQHFCSSITPTLPNRLYYWTGRSGRKANARFDPWSAMR